MEIERVLPEDKLREEWAGSQGGCFKLMGSHGTAVLASPALTTFPIPMHFAIHSSLVADIDQTIVLRWGLCGCDTLVHETFSMMQRPAADLTRAEVMPVKRPKALLPGMCACERLSRAVRRHSHTFVLKCCLAAHDSFALFLSSQPPPWWCW